MPPPNVCSCARARFRRASGQGPGAAADDGRDEEQLVFVHQPGRDGLGGEVRAGDGEVTAGRFLQLADLAGSRSRSTGPGGVRFLERGEYTILSAACQIRAKSSAAGDWPSSVCAVSQ